MKIVQLLLLALLPAQLEAQAPRLVLRGRGDPALDARLRELVRQPGRTLWTRDTLITRADTVREPLLIVGATVRLEGVLLSDVVAVGADLFVRPSARVQGHVLTVASGWYVSDLATVSGERLAHSWASVLVIAACIRATTAWRFSPRSKS